MSEFQPITYSQEEVFQLVQAAYRRGVDFTADHINMDGDEYHDLWNYVPKAAYDYADKMTAPKPNTPEQIGEEK